MQHPTSQFLQPDADEITVLIASDTGSNNHVLESVVADARRANPHYDFMMHLGDMATTSITGYYWILHEVRPKLAGTPLYAIPGNHDVYKRIAGVYHENVAYYTTVMGAAYYWFGYGDTLFIALDTSTSDMDDVQLAWLDATLKKIRPMFRNCIVFSHVPPINPRPELVSNHNMTPESAAKFADIISKYKIDAIFCGHVHFYSQTPFAGTTLYTIPPSGQDSRDPNDSRYGYVVLKMDKTGIHDLDLRYIDFGGDTREFFEEWWARDILSTRAQDCISVALTVFAFFLSIALALRVTDRIRRTK